LHSEIIENLEKRKKKHNTFIDSLEQIHEFLDDDRIKYEDVDEIKDSVEYYIDYNQDPDFVEDETLFDALFKKAEEAEEADMEDDDLEFSDEEDQDNEMDEEDENEEEEHDDDDTISPIQSPKKSKVEKPKTAESPPVRFYIFTC
jgi:CCR4-NOT transcription complex subunit 3